MSAKTVNIRFLQEGFVEAPVPEGFDKMSSSEKLVWAWEALNKLKDKNINEPLLPAAIEDSKKNIIVNTKEWNIFRNCPFEIVS